MTVSGAREQWPLLAGYTGAQPQCLEKPNVMSLASLAARGGHGTQLYPET